MKEIKWAHKEVEQEQNVLQIADQIGGAELKLRRTQLRGQVSNGKQSTDSVFEACNFRTLAFCVL